MPHRYRMGIRIWDKILTVVMLGLFAIALWPASFWLQIHQVSVDNGQVGQPIIMKADREIHREFDASWHVTVRKRITAGEPNWRVFCTASGAVDYIPNSSYPDPLTLDWWTNGGCSTLPSGQYRIHTTWQLEPRYSPAKRITAVSNIFEVTE